MNRTKWALLTGLALTIVSIVLRAAWETRPSRLRAMDGYDEAPTTPGNLS